MCYNFLMNILVLDDEKEIADLVEVYLKNENYNVLKCNEAKKAIDYIDNKKIDLVYKSRDKLS